MRTRCNNVQYRPWSIIADELRKRGICSISGCRVMQIHDEAIGRVGDRLKQILAEHVIESEPEKWPRTKLRCKRK